MNQKGFTLIELIAVIIILGALGAVAAPKFIDLTEAAADKAARQAVAEGKARLTSQYAIHLMNSDARCKRSCRDYRIREHGCR